MSLLTRSVIRFEIVVDEHFGVVGAHQRGVGIQLDRPFHPLKRIQGRSRIRILQRLEIDRPPQDCVGQGRVGLQQDRVAGISDRLIILTRENLDPSEFGVVACLLRVDGDRTQIGFFSLSQFARLEEAFPFQHERCWATSRGRGVHEEGRRLGQYHAVDVKQDSDQTQKQKHTPRIVWAFSLARIPLASA